MKTIIKKSLQSLLFVPVLALGVSIATPVLQSEPVQAQSKITDGINATNGGTAPTNTNDDLTLKSAVQTVTQILTFIIGAAAVIMIIYGGIRYVISGGDSTGVTAAKNTILYAVIGLVVAVLAYTIVGLATGGFSAENIIGV